MCLSTLGGTRSRLTDEISSPHSTQAHIVKLHFKFIIQPDDGQYTGPKLVVVCTNLCDNI